MKKLNKFLLTCLALVGVSVPLWAGIHAKATSTSHALEEVATELHSHVHHVFGPSYGAHGMEVTASALHSILHDWGHGTATEADVLSAVDAANAAFDSMREQFRANNVWADQDSKMLYDSVHRLLVLVNAYTASS